MASNKLVPRRDAFEDLQAAALMRAHLMFFLPWVFKVLHPGHEPLVLEWYLRAICQAFFKVACSRTRRLVINVPPRHLKSITSVAFVAWMLGRDPRLKFMLVTYGSKLSRDHLINLTRIMNHRVYRMLFPAARLTLGGIGQLLVSTTAGGGCRAVTVGGATTGHGADIIIIDDAMKAEDIVSEARRSELDRFYSGTLLTRLNSKKSGIIISIQQRLGEDDLPGRLIDAGAEHLCLPSYDDIEHVYDIGLGRIYRRPVAELLRPDDETMEVLNQLRRDMGPREFATQYLQLPSALEGNIIRTDAFHRFNLSDFPRSVFLKIVQSWDVACSEGTNGDYSVCLTFGYLDGKWYLIQIIRVHLGFPQLCDRAKAQYRLWKPDMVLIEDATFGQQLGQELRHRGEFWPKMIRPLADKVTRMVGQLTLIEEGDILIPEEAPWLSEFLKELRSFPSGRYDDQVDALAQFLDWSKWNGRWARAEYDPKTGRKLYVQRPDKPRRR